MRDVAEENTELRENAHGAQPDRVPGQASEVVRGQLIELAPRFSITTEQARDMSEHRSPRGDLGMVLDKPPDGLHNPSNRPRSRRSRYIWAVKHMVAFSAAARRPGTRRAMVMAACASRSPSSNRPPSSARMAGHVALSQRSKGSRTSSARRACHSISASAAAMSAISKKSRARTA